MNRQAVAETPKVVISRAPGEQVVMSAADVLVMSDGSGILNLGPQPHPPGCPCCSVNKSRIAPDLSQAAPVPDHVAAPPAPAPPASTTQAAADTHHNIVPPGAFVAVSDAAATPAAPTMADLHNLAAIIAPSPHVDILGGLGLHLHL